MQVIVVNNRADFDAFSEYLVQHHLGRAYKVFRYGLPLVCGIGSLVLLLLVAWLHSHTHLNTDEQLDMLACALLGMVCAFAWPLWKRFNFFMLRRKGDFGAPFTLELREEGVAVQRGDTWHQVSWSELRRVERTGEYLFLLVNTRAGLIIPRSAFPSPTSAHAFAEFAIARWRAAQSPASLAPLAAP